MYFCPFCAMALQVEMTVEKETRWFCQTCPYVCAVKKRIQNSVRIEKKQVDDIVGGDSFATAQTTNVKCKNPKCDSDLAYFVLFQTRSADEPMSEFYKCVKCSTQWREG